MPGVPGGGALPPTTYRGPTAKGLLEIEWDHPVYAPPKKEAGDRSASAQYRRALPRAEALAYVAGDDPRPLLVLRECLTCNGTDEALLKGGTENETTYLLASWFHCVKLPVDVMEEDHPFHELFVTDAVEHLFVCSVDGSNHMPLESQTSRTDLWDSMRTLVALEYEKKPDSAVRSIAKVLDKLDLCDQRWNELVQKRDAILEEDGPRSRKLPKLAREIAELEAQRAELREAFAQASRLKLKERAPRPEDPAEDAPASGA